MSKREYQQHPVKTNPHQEIPDKDPDTICAKSDKWMPTPETYAAFLVRDYELATHNIKLLMQARQSPVNAKELKDSLLHSTDVIDRVLTDLVSSQFLTENQGKYERAGGGRGALIR
jgi:hypothetical protein